MRDGKVKGMRRTFMVEILRTTKQGDKVHCSTLTTRKKERGELGVVCKQMCDD